MTLSSIFFKLIIGITAASTSADVTAPSTDGTGNEMLKPSGPKSPDSSHQITYKLSNGSEKWDADPRDRIIKAMDEAVAIYNKNGDFERVLTANWNPGTPTADANFGGWINFGGQIGTRTALHEIAHTLGIGTAPKWHEYSVKGKWTGKYGIEQLKEFDGPDAVLHCDNQHFWPYGLNYDTEVTKDSFKRNVMMVTAMRADMGLGPPPHPAAHALKAAKADAEEAHSQATKAQSDFNTLKVKLQSGLDSRPEVISALKAVSSSKAAYESTVATELKSVHQNADYQTAQAAAASARQKLDELQEDPSAKPDDRAAAAEVALAAKGKLTQMEKKDLAACQSVIDAGNAYNTAVIKLRDAREAPLKDDPQLLTDKQTLATANAKASAADQAVVTAAQAAAKEQSTIGSLAK